MFFLFDVDWDMDRSANLETFFRGTQCVKVGLSDQK